MFNIALWVLFSVFIIFPYQCSGDAALPIKLEIKELSNSRQFECSVAKHTVVNKGDIVTLQVSSPLLVHFMSCDYTETYQTTTINQTPEKDVQSANKTHRNNFELYIRTSRNCSCLFYTHRDAGIVKPTRIIQNKTYTVATCNFAISVEDPFVWDKQSLLVGLGFGLSWIIIPLIVGIVIFFKRRVQPVHDLKSLSAMQRPKHDRARYGGAPLKKPLISIELTERESGIYEALETIKDVTKATNNADGISASTANTNLTIASEGNTKPKEKSVLKSICKKFSLPGRRNTAQSEDTNDGLIRSASDGSTRTNRNQDNSDKRTTLDRIKERPPLPLPIEPTYESGEEYEAMSPTIPVKTPEPSRSKPPIPLPKMPESNNREFKGTPKKNLPLPPTKPLEKLPKPIPIQKKTLKSPSLANPDTVNELENVLKKKGIGPGGTSMEASARPKGLLRMPSQSNPPVSPKPASISPTVNLAQPTLPKHSGARLQPAAPIGRKPTKPSPMDAPVPPPISTLPRPAPSVQVAEPEEEYGGWDGEDWTYEPIPSHNIYNM